MHYPWNPYLSVRVPIARGNPIVARNQERIGEILRKLRVGSTVVANTDTQFPVHCLQTARSESRSQYSRS